jgi:hypothetical protein
VAEAALLVREEAKLSSPEAGMKVARRIVMENSELFRLAKTKSLAPKRKGADMMDDVEQWIRIFKELKATGRFSASNIILFDETGTTPGSDKSATQRIILRTQKKSQHVRGKTGKSIGVLPFATAAGEMLLVVFILPVSEYHGEDLGKDLYVSPARRSDRNSYHMVYVFTKKGKLDGEAWKAIVVELQARWELLHPGRAALLIGDSVGAHLNVEAAQFLAKKMIQQLFLVRNTTH